jgi:hypothetical protein
MNHLRDYFRFLVRIEQPVLSLKVYNNTFYMNGTDVYFQEAISIDGDVQLFYNYNNIFIAKIERVNAFNSISGKLLEYHADNNIYKALMSSTRFLTVRILDCD